MVTGRDLLEAQAFGRRRLVTAFVSGAPGGVEPARPGRALVGSLALAVLLLAGAALARMLVGGDPDGWDRPGLIVSAETGELYVIVERREEPELHAIDNLTSARLLLGADLAPTLVSGETIAAQQLGPDLGIPGAPPTVPAPSRLVERGWAACAAAAGSLTVTVPGTPGARAVRGGGLTVVSGGRYYVVATGRPEPGAPPRAHRYPVPAGVEPDPLLAALGLPIAAEARAVPQRWLRLFPRGGALDFATLALEGYGEPAPGRGPGRLPEGARIGQVVTVPGGRTQVLTAAGPAGLDPFARAVYESVARPPLAPPLSLDPVVLDEVPRVRNAVPPFAGARWPDALPRALPGEPCALLVEGSDGAPVTALAAEPSAAGPSAAGPVAPAARVRVEPGRGAYVREGGSSYLIGGTGLAHPLEGTGTAERLGYGEVEATPVPRAWLDLFGRGVALSRERALCRPGQETRNGADTRCRRRPGGGG